METPTDQFVEESKSPFDFSPQVSQVTNANQIQHDSYAGRSSIYSTATDITLLHSSVNNGHVSGHTSTRKIGYEEDAIKLEALLADDTRESLTQEIIASRKSPNRLGTTYQKAFID